MLIAANWKMNLNKNEIKLFSNFLKKNSFSNQIQTCIFPQSLYIDFLVKLLKNTPVHVGGQNCYHEINGSFTGEISAFSLKEIGCEYVIVGHSERRQLFNETNSYIKKCSESAINNSLTPIICVGESYHDRKIKNALNFVKEQILNSTPSTKKNLYIAYEPIWSIGTGEIPGKGEIFEMHEHIKEVSYSILKRNVKVLYGGSVNIHNINEVLSVGNVDGVLIGGASLKVKDFLAIYEAVVKHINN
jgi:triosephosphate isomerase